MVLLLNNLHLILAASLLTIKFVWIMLVLWSIIFHIFIVLSLGFFISQKELRSERHSGLASISHLAPVTLGILRHVRQPAFLYLQNSVPGAAEPCSCPRYEFEPGVLGLNGNAPSGTGLFYCGTFIQSAWHFRPPGDCLSARLTLWSKAGSDEGWNVTLADQPIQPARQAQALGSQVHFHHTWQILAYGKRPALGPGPASTPPPPGHHGQAL